MHITHVSFTIHIPMTDASISHFNSVHHTINVPTSHPLSTRIQTAIKFLLNMLWSTCILSQNTITTERLWLNSYNLDTKKECHLYTALDSNGYDAGIELNHLMKHQTVKFVLDSFINNMQFMLDFKNNTWEEYA